MKAKKITAVCTAALMLTGTSNLSPFLSLIPMNASAEETLTEPASTEKNEDATENDSSSVQENEPLSDESDAQVNELELVWNKQIYDLLDLDPDAEYAEIPEKVTIDGIEYTIVGIKNDFFRNMPNLKSVKLPSTMKTIGEGAFINNSTLTEIEIPEGVTTICENAFCNCPSLKKVKLPDSLTLIKTAAFENCALESIVIPNNVTTIKPYAFYHCSELSDVTLSDKLTALEDSVFGDCINLHHLVLPDSIRSIHKYSCIDCHVSVEYNWPADIKEIPSDFFEGVCVEKITIPEGVEKIDDYALINGHMEEIILPDSIKYIGKGAFGGCTLLKSIKIPDSITEIKDKTFNICYSLQKVELPDSITSIGKKAFYSCHRLSDINMPDGIETIGEDAFHGCSDLNTFKMPSSIKEVGNDAFLFAHFRELVIPSAMTVFDSSMFPQTYIRKLIIPDELEEIYCIKDECDIKIISGSENSIASEWAAENEVIFLPPDAPDINLFEFSKSDEGYLFSADCRGDIVIPSTYTYHKKEYPVLHIFSAAFLNQTNVTSVVIPDTVVSIGGEAFYGCTNLLSVTIPASVKTMGYEVFKKCSPDELIIKSADVELDNALKTCTIKKICGYSGSTAEEYALKNNIEFEAIKDEAQNEEKNMPGDSNCDGRIDLADVVMIMQSLVNADKYGIKGSDPSHITEQGIKNADVTGNDGMTNLDALTIQKYKLGIIESLS